mmetsp:Transcript_8528/g.20128  ORF Transcript_8528/g.20128 Transcript_8528/m.20128 type:complete len:213 (-) Transcript_8528:143-781(-)
MHLLSTRLLLLLALRAQFNSAQTAQLSLRRRGALLPLRLHRQCHPLQLAQHGRQLLQHAVFLVLGRAVLLEHFVRHREVRELAHRKGAQLAQKRTQRHRPPRAAPRARRIGADGTGLEGIVRTSKVPHHRRQCRRDAVIVLGRDNEEAVGGLDDIAHGVHRRRRLALSEKEVGLAQHCLPCQRSALPKHLDGVKVGHVVLDRVLADGRHSRG